MILSGRFSAVRSDDGDPTADFVCISGCCCCSSFLIVFVRLLALNVMVLPKSLIPWEFWEAIKTRREIEKESCE